MLNDKWNESQNCLREHEATGSEIHTFLGPKDFIIFRRCYLSKRCSHGLNHYFLSPNSLYFLKIHIYLFSIHISLSYLISFACLIIGARDAKLTDDWITSLSPWHQKLRSHKRKRGNINSEISEVIDNPAPSSVASAFCSTYYAANLIRHRNSIFLSLGVFLLFFQTSS